MREKLRPRLSAWQTSKNPQKSEAEVTLVWQLVISQLIKLIKSVTSLVLKKGKKVTTCTIVCVFLRKAPTKKLVTIRVGHFFVSEKEPTKN